jgi:hypothetical protein
VQIAPEQRNSTQLHQLTHSEQALVKQAVSDYNISNIAQNTDS